MHRGDLAAHDEQVAESEAQLRTAQRALADHPMVAHAGFLHDAEKEYAEARLCAAMVAGTPLAGPGELGVMAHSWMRGLAEAASELRRDVLDRLRAGDLEGGEALLEVMDEVTDALAAVDLPDALTGGLRRTVDSLRAVTERTRGDVTTTVLQTRLQRAIEGAGRFGAPEADR
ncbi:MAG: haloacid dehalogenase [Acidimicrobiia bacterium]